MPGRGGHPVLAGAGVGLVPTHPFPQVKSWLWRAKLDDSEENAVGSPPTLRAQSHTVLIWRKSTFRSRLYPSPQTDGIYPLLFPAGVQEQAPALPVQIHLCVSPAATVPGGCFGRVADAAPPTKRRDIGPNEIEGHGLCPLCHWPVVLGTEPCTVMPAETHPLTYHLVFPLLRAVTHLRKRGMARRRRRKGG